ncbi:MAG: tetratricopeptide repeat protein, partial [Vicingaceae bacterium]
MNRLFIIIIFFSCSFSGIAQNFADKDYYLVDSLEIDKVSESDLKLIDSCLTFFHAAKDDTTRLKAINTIVEESWDDKVWPKYNMWTYHFVQEKLKKNPNDKVKRKLLLRLAGSINNIGYHESTKGNLIEALNYYNKGLKIQQEIDSKEGMATSYNNIGTIHKKQGDIPNSLEYYHKSLKIYKEIDNTTGLGQALNNIGNIYQEQGDPDLALEYFYRGRNLYKKLGDERSVATILNNIGYTYFKKKNIQKALE